MALNQVIIRDKTKLFRFSEKVFPISEHKVSVSGCRNQAEISVTIVSK